MSKDLNTLNHRDLVAALENEFTGIVGFTELLRGDFEHVDERTEEVLAAAERALAMTRILAARLERVLHARHCRLNDEIHACEPMLRRVVGRGIDFVLRLDPSVETVPLDRREVESLLMQIVSAARAAMRESGRITIRTIAVDRASDDREVRLVVEDDAPDVGPADPRWALLSPDTKRDDGPMEFQALVLRDVGAEARFRVETGYGTTLRIDLPTRRTN